MPLLKVFVLCMKIMKYLKIVYRLLVYFTSFTVCSGDIKKKSLKMKKKKAQKMTSHTGHFQSFLFFFHPPDRKSEKIIP